MKTDRRIRIARAAREIGEQTERTVLALFLVSVLRRTVDRKRF